MKLAMPATKYAIFYALLSAVGDSALFYMSKQQDWPSAPSAEAPKPERTAIYHGE
jgi:hypothetical protein